MNREIKFRVFCEKHNRWEYYTLGDLICNSTAESNNEGGIFKQETWSQFTGLKDKNGVEIYEGDILEVENRNGEKTLYTVIFGYIFAHPDSCSYSWVAKNIKNNARSIALSNLKYQGFIKVIGN